MLVVMIGIRKSLDFLFARRELKILDDIMPEITKRNQHDMMDAEVGWTTKLKIFILGQTITKKDTKNKL